MRAVFCAVSYTKTLGFGQQLRECFAQARCCVARRPRQLEDAMNRRTLHKVHLIVVGLPARAEGSTGHGFRLETKLLQKIGPSISALVSLCNAA